MITMKEKIKNKINWFSKHYLLIQKLALSATNPGFDSKFIVQKELKSEEGEA